MKIKQLTSYPIPNELGMGNTNETYIRIENSLDVSDIFPPNEEITVKDCESNKSYQLKSKSGNEFRINQLGSIYRDYDVLPGDELKFTQIENGNKTVLFSVVKHNRVYLNVTSKGTEIVNKDRLSAFISRDKDNEYIVKINEGTLVICFDKSEKKRSDSPEETDFYKTTVNGTEIDKGSYYITIKDGRALLEEVAKNRVEEFIIDDIFLADEKEANMPSDVLPLQRILYGAPGTGKSYSVFSAIAIHQGKIKEGEKLSDELRKELENSNNIFRTTFHPDYDYAQFVGCYKPTKEDSEKLTIDYKFLLDKLSEFTNNYNQTTSAFLLGLEYRSELDRVLQAEHKTYNDLFKDAGCQSTNLPTMLTAGITANDRNRVLKSQITYSFTPQVFTNALVKAYENPTENVYLIIEEINRGNCAQIFGDIFQLLDRNGDGDSEYSISVDEDLKKYLEEKCPNAINNGKIKLPRNFNIIATMNTSDQSLFPMDSAFKRRWDWEYVPVKYGTDVDSSKFKITIGEKTYNWHTFLKAVNAKIKDVTSSEDKQMGNFFIKGDVDAKAFCNKVMFYLWNDVSKDYYGSNDSLFQYIEEDSKPAKHFSFNELFGENQTKLLHGFMKFVKYNPISKKESDGSDSVQSASEDSNNSQEA